MTEKKGTYSYDNNQITITATHFNHAGSGWNPLQSQNIYTYSFLSETELIFEESPHTSYKYEKQ